MSNSLALSPEQFIFAQDEELKTTSLKIAEAFGKEHKNVLAQINKITSQVSDSFGRLNFKLSEYEKENNLGYTVKHPMYELTKDGFIMVVMGFTGKKAFAIKEVYINAFNLMHKKLFPPRNTISPDQKQTIKKAVTGIAYSAGVKWNVTYNKIHEEFNVNSYHELTKEQYPAVCEFLGIKNVEGELLPAEQSEVLESNLVTVEVNDRLTRVIITRDENGQMRTEDLPLDTFVGTPKQIKNNFSEIVRGYKIIPEKLYFQLQDLQKQLDKGLVV